MLKREVAPTGHIYMGGRVISQPYYIPDDIAIFSVRRTDIEWAFSVL